MSRRWLAGPVLLVLVAAGYAQARPASDVPRFDSLLPKAASIAKDCPARRESSSNANGLLWTAGGAVYYTSAFPARLGVRSTVGRWSLPTDATPVAFLPCNPPVLAYTVRTRLRLVALGRPPETLSLGKVVFSGAGGVELAPDWRFVVVRGRTIRYLGGGSVVARGLPSRWRIGDVLPSPSDPRVFLAHVVAPGDCGPAGLYRISPAGSTRLLAYGSCEEYPDVAWSPDGSMFLSVDHESLFVGSGSSRARRKLSGHARVNEAIWSPDGREIAFGFRNSVWQTGVVDVATGVVTRLTNFHPKQVPPPRYYPHAIPLAWSPDGKAIATIYQAVTNGRSAIAAIPSTGGKPRTLFPLGF